MTLATRDYHGTDLLKLPYSICSAECR